MKHCKIYQKEMKRFPAKQLNPQIMVFNKNNAPIPVRLTRLVWSEHDQSKNCLHEFLVVTYNNKKSKDVFSRKRVTKFEYCFNWKLQNSSFFSMG